MTFYLYQCCGPDEPEEARNKARMMLTPDEHPEWVEVDRVDAENWLQARERIY